MPIGRVCRRYASAELVRASHSFNRLLQGKVKNVQRTNLVKAQKFTDMLYNAINKYNKRAIETSKVIEELIALTKEMNGSYKVGEASGLIKEEVVFYDALASYDTAEQVLGDEGD